MLVFGVLMAGEQLKISMIAAMANNRVIGHENKMPWHLPADLKFFKKMTLNKPIIMGRKTFESIGRPLPGRKNIVITRDRQFKADGIEVAYDTDTALGYAQGAEEVVIIGGGHIYQQYLDRADELYLTLIDIDVAGDTYFPDYQSKMRWDELWQQHYRKADGARYDYRFVHLKKGL